MTTEKANYDNHEALDRTHLIVEMIEAHLVNHQGLTTMERIEVQTAIVKLNKVYQSIGARK